MESYWRVQLVGNTDRFNKSDYVQQLDSVLSVGNRPLLEGAGSVSHAQAIEKATAEYRKWQTNTLSPVEEEYMRTIKAIAADTKNNTFNT